MKKKLSLIMLFSAFCMSCLALSETSIILHHGNDVKVYDGADKLNTVFNDAQEGDIVYLGKGTYGGFSITKKIYVRGAGNGQTLINGDVSINIDEEDIEYTEPILIGLRITGNIILYRDITGVTIQQCQCSQVFKSESNNQYNVTLDRCWINEIQYSNRLHETSFNNCKINIFDLNYEAPYDCVIRNCNVLKIGNYLDRFRGTIMNSIIGQTYGDLFNSFRLMTLQNSILSSKFSIDSNVLKENCYIFSDMTDFLYSNTLECKFSNDVLKEESLLGTDGTVIGCYGGPTPFTLALAVPTVDVKKSTFDVDNEKKMLNVKINLTGTTENE